MIWQSQFSAAVATNKRLRYPVPGFPIGFGSGWAKNQKRRESLAYLER
jgi:hypothetical protein